MVYIPLTNSNRFAYVSDRLFLILAKLDTKWSVYHYFRKGIKIPIYICSTKCFFSDFTTGHTRWGAKHILLSRVVLGTMFGNKNKLSDHRNHCIFDNTDDNLRIVTHKQNMQNCLPVNGSYSGYRYVTRNYYRFKARVQKDGIEYNAGSFTTAIEAAKAADKLAYELNGEHAYLNFPELIYGNTR